MTCTGVRTCRRRVNTSVVDTHDMLIFCYLRVADYLMSGRTRLSLSFVASLRGRVAELIRGTVIHTATLAVDGMRREGIKP